MSSVLLSQVMKPPPIPKEVDGDWGEVEKELGTKLPNDFKDFIRLYGSGTIGNFLSILNPFSSRPTINLLEQSKRQLDALRILRSDFGEENPFELYPTKGGLLPVAITDNGDVVHWLTKGAPLDWTVVVNGARSPDYEQFECNLTTFLVGLLERTICCRAFPISVFSEDSSFHCI